MPKLLSLLSRSNFGVSGSRVNFKSFSTRNPVPPSFSTSRNFRMEFNSDISIEKATIPPASWYKEPEVLQAEKFSVFRNNWVCAGRVDQLNAPGDYFTGRLLGEPFIVCMDDNRSIRAFYNVCRHHGTRVADDQGHVEHFQCPYHGWTYDLQGRLKKANRLKGIKNFRASEYGLRPIAADNIGPFIFLHFSKPVDLKQTESKAGISHNTESLDEQLGSQMQDGKKVTLHSIMQSTNYSDLIFLKRVTYKIGCNWKVYVDNYLDGGYHVPYAHSALGKRLDLTNYVTTIFEKFSIQSCPASSPSEDELKSSKEEAKKLADAEKVVSERPPIERVSGDAFYAWIYPNFMINRYGPWMDTNLVWPINERECFVFFDYFLEPKLLKDEIFIRESLKASDQVQVEDTYLCESVQDGLNSTQFHDGRYAPSVEYPMHHFHKLLHQDLMSVPVAQNHTTKSA